MRRRRKKAGATDVQGLLEAALGDLGNGAFAKTIRTCEKVLKHDPDNADAFRLAAMAAYGLDNGAGAVAFMERLVQARGDDANAHSELGALLAELGRFEEAETVYRRANALMPDQPETLAELGAILTARGETGEAETFCRRAVELAPGSAAAIHALACALELSGKQEDALPFYRKATHLDPANATIAENLEKALWANNGLEELENLYRRKAAAVPGDVDTQMRLARILRDQGKLLDARSLVEKTRLSFPEDPVVCENLAVLQFLAGEFEPAWKNYRARHLKTGLAERALPFEEWKGDPLQGKTILVRGEQGVGDEVNFAGFIADLMGEGARVVLECDPRLKPLLERSFERLECVPLETPPHPRLRVDDIDFQIMSGDLADRQWYSLGDRTARKPYLRADKNPCGELRSRYREGSGEPPMLVGIAWRSGNPAFGPRKTMSLHEWEPILRLPGIRFVDLQYGDTEAERRAVAAKGIDPILHDDSIDQMADIDGFAAQIAALDLVLSISNTTVHVSGGLGVPTWVILNKVPMWVWGLDGEDCGLYPSLRLFRQRDAGDWTPVIERITHELTAMRSEWQARLE